MVKADYKSNQQFGLPKSNVHFQHDAVRSEAEAEIDEDDPGLSPSASV